MKKDITGQRFGKLVVKEYVETKNSRHYYSCLCDCGNTSVAHSGNLIPGGSKSCGCSRGTHHMSGTPEFISFNHAKGRCTNKNNKSYASYGGRGIKFKFKSFDFFYAHIGPRPSKRHSLDRINNEGNYEPGNVRWATMKEQQRNKRISLNYTIDGITMSLIEWSEVYGVKYKTVYKRIRILNWGVEKALTATLWSK